MTIDTRSQPLTTPREAAIAGIIFSLLMIVGLGIIRLCFPDGPAESMVNPGFLKALQLALHLVPFAGIAFLWFLGVLRNRMGASEDKFFATVCLGSGLLFVASLFASGAVTEAALRIRQAQPTQPISDEVYYFARQASSAFLNVFAIKMAGVFILSTSTIALRTAILPRWIAFSGFASSLILLLVISSWLWIAVLFPVWTMVVSAYILVANRKPRAGLDAPHPASGRLESSTTPAE